MHFDWIKNKDLYGSRRNDGKTEISFLHLDRTGKRTAEGHMEMSIPDHVQPKDMVQQTCLEDLGDMGVSRVVAAVGCFQVAAAC